MLCHPCLLGVPRTWVQKGPSLGQWKKAPHGGPRWFRVTLQPTFLKREKKEGLRERRRVKTISVIPLCVQPWASQARACP